jgi:integral membrane protein
MENTPTPTDAIFSTETQIKIFRYIGWLEGLSFLGLLLIAMPMKYVMGIPEATRLAGSVHGLLFVAYVIIAFQISGTLNWKKSILFQALIAAVLPLGTFIFDRKYLSDKK